MKKNKILLISTVIVSALALSGCSILLDMLDNGSSESNANFDVDKVDVNGKTIIQQTYKDYSNNHVNSIDYCPTNGNLKILVIPVWFSDSGDYIATNKKDKVRQDIETAYFGTNGETGWRSVKTYYEELSNNAVTISGTVSDWYSTSYTAYQAGVSYSVTADLVKTATDWYFNNNKSDTRKSYDSDNNGYIDAVMLIYGAPDSSALNNDALENLWAYCFWLQQSNTTSQPIPNAFFWASYDFMYSNGSRFSPTPAGSEYGSGDTAHCKIDAHTYIHEMGHIFGLEDYYDYATTKYCPAGGFSMQDYNVGSHDPYSVMALGWANPYVVTENSEVNIGTFQKTRDLVVVTESWNGIGSPFDEYLILELYSPTGLNELDSTYTYSKSPKGPTRVGIRLWHVDARLAYCTSYDTIKENGQYVNVPKYSPNQITCNTKEPKATYGVNHAFSNTYNKAEYCSVLGEKYYDYNILQLIRKSTLYNEKTTSTISNSDLFTSGTYSLSKYSDQFVKSSPFKMNSGSYAAWNFKIEITGSGNDATAKIAIVK